jgi:hypothetical protein
MSHGKHFDELLSKRLMPVGKYRGQPILDICVKDRNYVNWCIKNISPEFSDILVDCLDKTKGIPTTSPPFHKCCHLGVVKQHLSFTGRCSFISKPFHGKGGSGTFSIVSFEDEYGYSVSGTLSFPVPVIKGVVYRVEGVVTSHGKYKERNQTMLKLMCIERGQTP